MHIWTIKKQMLENKFEQLKGNNSALYAITYLHMSRRFQSTQPVDVRHIQSVYSRLCCGMSPPVHRLWESKGEITC